ncbi:MAG: 6-phosphofructokinase [Candidatus Dadabacteria bacterium]|nr:6-phosphofructokinase [Candidatus Dadabacteria bacterium]
MSGNKNKKTSSETLGILVGGGPAPGINGVISAVTIEAINEGKTVIGILDGFRWLAQGDKKHIRDLTIYDTSRIHLTGGSILGTSRENPTTSSEKMQNVIRALKELGVRYLLTIGGDDTMFSASRVEAEAKGYIKVAHVPKTIDNDLPLPGYTPTFGFETARHHGTNIVQYLMEDAKTTGRWYLVITMGRKTGHLALGIGKASGATLTIIPEEFSKDKVQLDELISIIEGSIVKRLSMGREDGVVVLAEGLSEKFYESELKELKEVEKDEYGNIRLSEIDLGKLLKNEVRRRLIKKGIKTTIVDKNIGYELRCAPPIPFDAKYTRDLGYGAIKFLLEGGSGALVSIQAGKMVPIYFDEILDPKTGRTKIRPVDINTESYEVAEKYMIKITKEDIEDPEKVNKLSTIANMKPSEFVDYFSKAVRGRLK